MKQGRCFRCLKKDHLSKDCTSGRVCYKCSGKHHVSLCEENLQTFKSDQQEKNRVDSSASYGYKPNKESRSNTRSSHTVYASSCDTILLQTAQAFVESPMANSRMRAGVIFDSGSQRSYVTKKLKEHLNIETTRKESLMIQTFGNSDTSDLKICEIIELIIKDVHGESSTSVQAFVVPTICPPLGNQEIDKAKGNFLYLEDIELADNNDGESKVDIDILIGADFIWKFFTGAIKQGEVSGPVASETKLGWVLSSPIPPTRKNCLSSVNLVSTHVLRVQTTIIDTEPNEQELVHKLWDLDSIGIRESETVLESFSKNITFEDGRYVVSLPVKENLSPPDNYELSLSRLNSLIKRLQRNKELYHEYDKIIKEQEGNGVIERVVNNDKSPNTTTHYLPHHGVIRNDAMSTKLRIVYDASAKSRPNLPSLNDCIHIGPPLSSTLLDILIRFRAHKVGLVADIEKAFLNISVDEGQRDLMRFLWVKDIEEDDPELVTYRFNRVLFGMNCSPFLLNATLSHHIQSYYSKENELAERVLRGFYVDDWTSGGNDDNEAFTLYKSVKSCLAAGGFNLRKWASNRKELMSKITECRANNDAKKVESMSTVESDNESYAKISVGGLHEIEPTKGEHKVLGIKWNLISDILVINLENLSTFARGLPINKRNILRITVKLFDPMGIVSPIMIPLKILFQELCLLKYDWDSCISDGKMKNVLRWLSDADQVKEITIPRYYMTIPGNIDDHVKSASLHAFGDASKRAYCSVVYLCMETHCGYRHVSIITSKSRLAPASELTIPRLELIAALITARLITTVMNALQSTINIARCYCWTDSKAVLYWITHGKELKQFVQNRVNTILSLTTIDMWNHCPGIENPADIGSRGCMASTLVNNEMWWNGPHWLKGPPDEYPRLEGFIDTSNVSDDCLREFRVSSPNLHDDVSTSLLSCSTTKDKGHFIKNISKIIDCKRYSSIMKLYRITAIVLHFIKMLKKGSNNKEILRNNQITMEDLLTVEQLWIYDIQKQLCQQKNWNDLQQQLGLFWTLEM